MMDLRPELGSTCQILAILLGCGPLCLDERRQSPEDGAGVGRMYGQKTDRRTDSSGVLQNFVHLGTAAQKEKEKEKEKEEEEKEKEKEKEKEEEEQNKNSHRTKRDSIYGRKEDKEEFVQVGQWVLQVDLQMTTCDRPTRYLPTVPTVKLGFSNGYILRSIRERLSSGGIL